MEQKYGAVIILSMCVVVLLIGMMKKKAERILNFFVRMVVGLVCVYFLNSFLQANGVAVAVGINPLSAITLGSLGTGGFALLYGIAFCQFL